MRHPRRKTGTGLLRAMFWSRRGRLDIVTATNMAIFRVRISEPINRLNWSP